MVYNQRMMSYKRISERGDVLRTDATPQTNMMKDIHREGRSCFKAILLGGFREGINMSLLVGICEQEVATYLEERIWEEENSQGNEILLVADVKIILQMIKLEANISTLSWPP